MDITLNVQGHIFQTTYTTLINIPYFKNMFEDCGSPSKEGNPNETITLNRPAHIFKHILSLATDPKYPYPEKYKFELDFYGFDYDNVNFYRIRDDIIGDLLDVRRDIIDEFNDMKQKIFGTYKECADSNCRRLLQIGEEYCDDCYICKYDYCNERRENGGSNYCYRHNKNKYW
jgi:hypothetical protein